jgi:hypothetical protein
MQTKCGNSATHDRTEEENRRRKKEEEERGSCFYFSS